MHIIKTTKICFVCIHWIWSNVRTNWNTDVTFIIVIPPQLNSKVQNMSIDVSFRQFQHSPTQKFTLSNASSNIAILYKIAVSIKVCFSLAIKQSMRTPSSHTVQHSQKCVPYRAKLKGNLQNSIRPMSLLAFDLN